MSVPPPKRQKTSRNVFGKSHWARVELDEIHGKHHSPPSSPKKDELDSSPDRRRNSKGRSVVLREYTREGLLSLWAICTKNYDLSQCINAFNDSEECWLWRSHKPEGKGGGHDLSIPPFSSEHGYGVLQRGRGKAKLKVIQLAVWSKAEQLCEHGSNTSHLCATPMCMRPEHLVIETCGKNNRRVGCPCWSFVPNTNNQQRQLVCPHDPPCLRPDEKGLRDKHRVHDPSVTHGWREMTEEEVKAIPPERVRVKYKKK